LDNPRWLVVLPTVMCDRDAPPNRPAARRELDRRRVMKQHNRGCKRQPQIANARRQQWRVETHSVLLRDLLSRPSAWPWVGGRLYVKPTPTVKAPTRPSDTVVTAPAAELVSCPQA
jgi:hypothetical protein